MGNRNSRNSNRWANSKFTFRKPKLKYWKNQVEYFELTVDQVRQLKSSYHAETHDKAARYPGDKITERMIFSCPHARRVFERYQEAHRTNASHTTPMNDHYEHISRSLRQVIANLDKPDVATQLLRKIGAQHVKYSDFGFTISMFKTFGDALIQQSVAWGTHRKSRRQRDRFYNVVLFMIGQMQYGYETACGKLAGGRHNATMAISQLDDRNSPRLSPERQKRTKTF